MENVNEKLCIKILSLQVIKMGNWNQVEKMEWNAQNIIPLAHN